MKNDPRAHYAFRSKMVDRLISDLYGPSADGEVLDERPLERYVTGILWPDSGSEDRAIVVDEPNSEDASGEPDVQDSPIAGALVTSPVSAGLTFSVDRASTDRIRIVPAAARYEPESSGASDSQEASSESQPESKHWRRVVPEFCSHEILLDSVKGRPQRIELVPDGLQLYVLVRKPDRNGLVTITAALRNLQRFVPGASIDRDQLAWFQVRLLIETDTPAIVDRRAYNDFVHTDPDLRSSSLLYRNHHAFGTGHGCAVRWPSGSETAVSAIETDFVPRTEVPRAQPAGTTADLSMEFLGRADREQVLDQLDLVCTQYENWIETKQTGVSTGIENVPSHLTSVAEDHLNNAREALARMRNGVELLREDSTAFEAFRTANRAMHLQRSRQDWVRGGRAAGFALQPQSWRPFQIGFVLLNLPSLTDRDSDERDIADLLWFPAGGGKTEAYLALIAYLIVLRRLRDPEVEGTAVLMRYTLRLLTIQQFERAAMLMCSLETIRRDSGDLGALPFGIGLWVGSASTPNRVADANKALAKLRNGKAVEEGNPMQLQACPWCGTRLEATDYVVDQSKTSLTIKCHSSECEFRSGLPAYVVDEDVYAKRPELVIGTVDKFARMAWDGSIATLFGRIAKHDIGPDLIIQDELHLISGPLGSTVGLFETAVDLAAGRQAPSGRRRRPKLIASTATIRRADGQIRSVFDRESRLFPPPGLNPDDSFFARPADSNELGTREYVGVMAPGTSHATLMIRAYTSVLNTTVAEADTPEEIRDAYWTLIGYFNSLRVLGSAFLQVNDDVATRLKLLANREGRADGRPIEMEELTSRRPSSEIPSTLKRLESGLGGGDRPLDVVLATNMISVGLDVDRLGLMAVMGQPPSSAEYIQATSRVGRKHPGLVITIFNSAKSRDRSHYEGFSDFHQSLYRAVEATSATPFADRSRDKTLHAAFVAALRMTAESLRDNSAVTNFDPAGAAVEYVEKEFRERSLRTSHDDRVVFESTKADLTVLSNVWSSAVRDSENVRFYVDKKDSKRALLIDASDALADDAIQGSPKSGTPWATPQSMRNVDAETALQPISPGSASGPARTDVRSN